MACEFFVHLSKLVNGVATWIVPESLLILLESVHIKCRQVSLELDGSQMLHEAPFTELDKIANIVFCEGVGGKRLGVLLSCTLEFEIQQ